MTEIAYQPEPEVLSSLDEYYQQVVTEDDEPVDNLFSEKQQRLLAQSLYASWTPPPGKKQAPGEPRPFLVAANVGVFFAKSRPPLVPDLFLSLDVQPHADWYAKEHRSYFVWEFGKVPEVVVEIVSNREGGELSRKLDGYAEIGVLYDVVYDPQRYLSEETLRVFVLRDGEYQELEQPALPRVGLRLMRWDGVFEGHFDTWLRWCDAQGRLLLTGEERAAEEAIARREAEERVAEEAIARREAEERVAEEAIARREAEERVAEEAIARREAEERVAEEAIARREAEERAAEEATARHEAEERARIEAERAARLAEKLRELGADLEQF
jgi:Uma2 family endonuclease